MTYGVNRLEQDLRTLGYNDLSIVKGNDNVDYVVIKEYKISLGRFSDRAIDLAIPVPIDYPRTVGASIQIKSFPHLLEKTDSIPNVRNIIDSALGAEWRYWSYRFMASDGQSTQNLIHQINGIFRNI